MPAPVSVISLDRLPSEEQTGHVETVGIVVVGFGTLVAFLLLIVKATRKLMPQRQALLPFRSQGDTPPRPGDLSGDREPRRPLLPSRSVAVALDNPVRDDEPHEGAVRQFESRPDEGGGQRLAG